MKRSTLIGLLCLIFLTSTAFADDPPIPGTPPAAAGAPAGGGGAGGGAPAGGAPAAEPGAPARPTWEEDLDRLGGEDTPPAGGGTPPGGTPPADRNKRSGQQPGKPGAKPGAAAPPAGGAPQPDPDEPPANLTTNGDLRKWATEQRKAAKTHEATVTQLKQRIDQFEQQTRDAGNPVEMARQLTAMKQQVDDYEQRVRMLDYERSTEYADKFEKPYNNAWVRATKEIAELEVYYETGEKDENQQPKISTRVATKGDFQYVMQLPLGKASQAATKLFRDNAAIVMGHYNRIRDLRQNAIDAIEEYKTKGKEHEETKKAKLQTETATHNQLWKTTNERMGADEKRKEFWGKSEDPEEQKELERGFSFADQLFGESYEKLPMEDKILLHAAIRHRVAGFHKLAYRNKSLRSQIADLNKTIEELRGSGPGRPGGGSPAGGGGAAKETWEAGIEKLPE